MEKRLSNISLVSILFNIVEWISDSAFQGLCFSVVIEVISVTLDDQ